ncbi:acyl-CoA dehydrogenase [Endozoicomonas elysicola]|uniref:Acyl-CoA dehydrogenase n=2 Tax=Endozoicomonas elysicola TaxID=305900 RepID=A0A081KD40_9GAMM|nr:acyl-CoA dehydrogenase family protein [Endozoicomonas elysicola]KEI72066.1 acyl-CoA dehydrogenase [Endozoicomonas elysicola]
MNGPSKTTGTHTVFNQPPPLDPYNLFSTDTALKEALKPLVWAEPILNDYGYLAGHEFFPAGFLANQNLPQLRTHDRFGHRVDQVDFHPAYHQLMKAAIENGLPSLPWQGSQTGAHMARAAMMYLHNQVEAGTCCPLTMTFAAAPALNQQPDVASRWLPLINSRQYDPDNKPWYEKSGVTIGMAMTEKQGGTDVRANTTRAAPLGKKGPGQLYALTGHKWFCSAPMSDGFLVLAQAAKGLSCFLLPRWREDGQRNSLYIQRLKDKLGNCSNASAEVELQDAHGWLIGEEGRGVHTIIQMVALTRFDCITGSAALMRQAVVQAVHHCSYRQIAGKVLTEHPLMENVLADLILESEAALALSLRVAQSLDSPSDEHEQLFCRLATAIGKYWVCKRAPGHINEAQECLGGGGYVEESILPRLYREAPVNSIWEGSGNVQCLDILRTFQREPESLGVMFAELEKSSRADPQLDQCIAGLKNRLANISHAHYEARRLVEDLAICLQASLLLQSGNALVASTFLRGRLDKGGLAYGTLPASISCKDLIERARVC